MFKIVGILVFIAMAATWLRLQASNASAKGVSRKTIDNLKKGKLSFAVLSETLSMMIRSKVMGPAFNLELFNQRLSSFNNMKLLNKTTVLQVEKHTEHDSIVIAEAIIKDFIAGTRNSNKEVDVVYPCWIYIKINETEGTVDFKSSFPQDKEHQYALEDLADKIYEQCISQ